jgi:predicted HTH transcriptional regulator
LGKRLGKELNDNQQAILHLISLDNKITIKELAIQLGISTTAVENNIKKLREMALLARNGGRKDGFWQVCITQVIR